VNKHRGKKGGACPFFCSGRGGQRDQQETMRVSLRNNRKHKDRIKKTVPWGIITYAGVLERKTQNTAAG